MYVCVCVCVCVCVYIYIYIYICMYVLIRISVYSMFTCLVLITVIYLQDLLEWFSYIELIVKQITDKYENVKI